MPRIAHRAAYKAASDSFSLSLAVQHALRLPPEYAHSVHPDAVARNPLVFTLAGATNGTLATRDQLVSSKTTSYVVEYLRKNAIELGLDYVSNIAISELKQHPGFTVTFARAKTTDLFKSQPALESLHLEYTWKTRPVQTNESVTLSSDFDSHPFSTDLTLPLWTLLNQVVLRFVKNGLVRRYPLVFGCLARQFNNEMAYFQPMIMSITRILRRSLDPAFRTQCRHLFKILERRFAAVIDLDHTTEIPDRQGSRQMDFTEAVFYLAMRLAFKASMKLVEFRGRTHRYIVGVEDHELLETEPPPIGIAVLSPEDDIFLEQDDGDTRPSFKGLSLFDILDMPQFVGNLGHADSSTDALPLDTDSEDEYYMFEVPGTSVGDIGVELDQSDEEFSPWSSVAHFVGQPRGHLPCCIESSQGSNESSGNSNSSQIQNSDGIYVDSESFPIPSTNDRNTQASLHTTTLMESHTTHTTQQARSGDTEASQEKDEMNLMGHLEEHRMQVARNISQTEAFTASTASTALDLGFSLDIDDDYMDMDDKNPAFCQLYTAEDHHCSKAKPTLHSTNHEFDHEDLLDVISEELFSDEEFDMDDLFDDEGSMSASSQVRCSTIAYLVEEQMDAVNSASEGMILVDEMRGPDSERSEGYFTSTLPQEIKLYEEDRDMIDDCSGREIETDFMELAM